MTQAKHTALPEFLTKAQIVLAAKLYEEHGFANAKAQIQKHVIEPNMTVINGKLGQENDPSYLAYAVVYVLSETGN